MLMEDSLQVAMPWAQAARVARRVLGRSGARGPELSVPSTYRSRPALRSEVLSNGLCFDFAPGRAERPGAQERPRGGLEGGQATLLKITTSVTRQALMCGSHGTSPAPVRGHAGKAM